MRTWLKRFWHEEMWKNTMGFSALVVILSFLMGLLALLTYIPKIEYVTFSLAIITLLAMYATFDTFADQLIGFLFGIIKIVFYPIWYLVYGKKRKQC